MSDILSYITIFVCAMVIETEKTNSLRRRSLEGREIKAEQKEKQDDAELESAAAMERADVLIREAKTSKKQMQNIVLHMQTVLSAIRQLRQQLQLAEESDDPTSVKQDKKQIEELKKKIREYGDELEKMRGDLVREQMEELSRRKVGMTTEELQRKAEKLVEEMIQQVKQ